MNDSEKKVNKNTYDISFIKRVTRKFLEVSRCSRAKQRQSPGWLVGCGGGCVLLFILHNVCTLRKNELEENSIFSCLFRFRRRVSS